MERPQSSVPERPLKKFRPNSFSIESFSSNFHRNPAKSIQIIPKLSKADLSKFIDLGGLRYLADALQKDQNVREILSLLHHKKVPFDVDSFGKSGLGERVFKIGKNKKHPLFERASGLLKRWKKAAKRSGSRSPRDDSKEKEKKEQPQQIVPEKPRSRKINFQNVPQQVEYDPEGSVLAFRKIAEYRAPPVGWSLPPIVRLAYRIPKSRALEEELQRCKSACCTEAKDTPVEKYQLRSILPSPIEINCMDSTPQVESFPAGQIKKEKLPLEEYHYRNKPEVPTKKDRNPPRKRKFKEERRKNFNSKNRRHEGEYSRKEFKRRRFDVPPRYQESHSLKSKTNTEQVNLGVILSTLLFFSF